MENVYHIDDEDFGDLIYQIEKSFGFEFNEDEITNLMTIDEFSELVISKTNMKEGQQCTSQITFYRIRKALVEKLGVDKNTINPNMKLESIFPKKTRIKDWNKVFGEYNRIELQPSSIPYGISILTAIISFFFLFASYKLYAIPIFISSIILTKILVKYGKTLPVKYIRELTEQIVRFNYKIERAENGTINVSEIKKLIFQHLTDWLEPNEVKTMNMETKINYID
mgnify:CR=1 FL=1